MKQPVTWRRFTLKSRPDLIRSRHQTCAGVRRNIDIHRGLRALLDSHDYHAAPHPDSRRHALRQPGRVGANKLETGNGFPGHRGNLDSIKATTNEHGSVRSLFDAPTATLNRLECHVTTLNPGMAAHPPHHHSEEEVVIIREGTVEALINGEWIRVGPGSVVFNACNITHDVRNVGDVPAVYHVSNGVHRAHPCRHQARGHD